MIGAGDLDRRITIRRAAWTKNDFNEDIAAWSDLATVWAKTRDASASETYRAEEVGAEITTRFTVRWSETVADVDPRDRVLFDGQEYDIVAVRNIRRRQEREIDAVTRAEKT